MLLILHFVVAVLRGYFYQPGQPMIWHPLYRKKGLSTKRRRELRIRMLPDEWTDAIWQQVLDHWGHRCAACGKHTRFLQRDHLIPVAHRDCPGSVPSNLIPLCKACNKDKSAQDFATWYYHTFDRYPHDIIDHIHTWQYWCLEQGET